HISIPQLILNPTGSVAGRGDHSHVARAKLSVRPGRTQIRIRPFEGSGNRRGDTSAPRFRHAKALGRSSLVHIELLNVGPRLTTPPEETMKLRFALVGLAALGSLAAATSASAMPL